MSIESIISITGSISSIVLSILAIWLALYHKKESDIVTQKTQDFLSEIRTEAKILSQIAMPELHAYGEAVRNFVFKEVDKNTSNNDNFRIDSIALEIEKIKDEFKAIKESNDIINVKSKMEDIEKKVIQFGKKEKSTIKNLDKITVSFEHIDGKIIETSLDQFRTFQSFLNTMYSNFMVLFVPEFTYGKKWIFTDEKGKEIKKVGTLDTRSLSEAGIKPDMKLIAKLL